MHLNLNEAPRHAPQFPQSRRILVVRGEAGQICVALRNDITHADYERTWVHPVPEQQQAGPEAEVWRR